MDNATKSAIDNFLVNRFDHLNKMAGFITRRQAMDPSDKDELFAYLIEHLYTNDRVPEIVLQGQTNLEGYAVRVMKNAWMWGNTPNQMYRKRVSGANVEKACADCEEVETQEEPVISLPLDERFIGLTDDQVVRLMNVEKAYLLLEPHEKKLYKMYYVDGLTIRKIAAMIKISGNAVHKMIVVMRNKLKDEPIKKPTRKTSVGKENINQL